MAAIDDLATNVAEDTTVKGSAEALLTNLKARLDAALAGGNLEPEIRRLSDEIGRTKTSLANKVLENTPSEP